MQIPFRWLKEFIDIDVDADRLVRDLTMSGVKVDEVQSANPGIEKVVAARVLDISGHPSSENLKIARIDAGPSGIFEVVCGAPNLQKNKIVPFAPPGAKLPHMRVEEAVIRGVKSPGMLLSEKELGIGDDASGLMYLPGDVAPGSPLERLLELDDLILVLDVTPNRGDCLSILGVARQIGAIYSRRARIPEFLAGGDKILEPVSEGLDIQVQLEDSEGCTRYLGGIARNVKIGPSPLWLQNRLRKAGFRPINNVVDITNYLVAALGHPMHAFDMARIEGKKIIVRRAQEGETVRTLDGIERKLIPEDLVIADAVKTVAIAGVMGGLESEITDNTEDIFLEIAVFDPVRIRRTSKRLGLVTESSQRFERGVDAGIVESVMKAALLLLERIAGARSCSGYLDIGERTFKKRKILLERSYLERYTGNEVPLKMAKNYLERLLFEVKEKDEQLEVEVPSHRNDCLAPVDLVEEICALHGYMSFPDTLPSCTCAPRMEAGFHFLEKIKDIMKGLGFSEAISFGFGSVEAHEALPGLLSGPVLELVNPIGSSFRAMRQSLIPALLEAEKVNLRQNRKNLRLFEIGRTFHIQPSPQIDDERLQVKIKDGYVTEVPRLAFLLTEPNPAGTWKGIPRELDFSHIRGVIEVLGEELNARIEFEPACDSYPFLHDGQRALLILEGKKIGFAGKLHPRKADHLEVEKNTFLAELELDLLEKCSRKSKVFKELARYPASFFDIAIVVDEKVTHRELEMEIMKSGGPLLEKVELFDVYRGRGIDQGQKSMAYSLVFRSRERTLRDEEVKESVDMILQALRAKFRARLREI